MQKLIFPIFFLFLGLGFALPLPLEAKPDNNTPSPQEDHTPKPRPRSTKRIAREQTPPKKHRTSTTRKRTKKTARKRTKKTARKRTKKTARKHTKKTARKHTKKTARKRTKKIARSVSSDASDSEETPTPRRNRRNKHALAIEDQHALDAALKKIGVPAPSTRALRNADFQLPKQLGVFPVPLPIAARVRFWHQVFGGAQKADAILFDPPTRIILKELPTPGAELSPTETPAQRRIKTNKRREISAAALQNIRTQLKELAAREARAEADAIAQSRNRQRACLQELDKKRLRAICWNLVRYQPETIDRTRWHHAFKELPPSTRQLYRKIRKEPRYQTSGWHKMFRYLARTKLSWQSSYRHFFQHGLRIERRYRPHIQATLRKAGLPPQLSALPFVESMYNPWVRSFVGALGLWQLMPDTAKELGLFVPPQNKSIPHRKLDERFDPIFATHAASRFIKLCRHFFPTSWPLAITSYNQGPGRILNEARRLQTKKLDVIIQRSRNRGFGFDGRNFYAKFLASALLIHNDQRASHRAAQKPIRFRELLLPEPLWLEDLLKLTQLSKKTLDLYNPMLRKLLADPDHPIPAYFPLRLPIERFASIKAALKKRQHSGPSTKIHTTQKRETPYRIAKRYNIPLSALLKANSPSLTKAHQSAFSKELQQRKDSTSLPLTTLCIKQKDRKIPYKIRSLARKHCPKPLSPSRTLPPHITLRIPAQRLASASNAPLTTYRTKGGEPLGWLACQVCTTPWQLRALNPDIPIGRLPAGKSLRVPSCPRARRALFSSCRGLHYARSAPKSRKKQRKRRKRR